MRAKEEEEFSPHDELLLQDFIRVVVVETLRSVERNVRLLNLQRLPQTLLALTYHHRDAFSFFESAKSTLREALDCERVRRGESGSKRGRRRIGGSRRRLRDSR